LTFRLDAHSYPLCSFQGAVQSKSITKQCHAL